MIFAVILIGLLAASLVFDSDDDSAPATMPDEEPTIIGDETDDLLHGTIGDDIMHGYAGDDTMSGSTGNDTLNGHSGDDTLRGDNGRDLLDGGYGADLLYGGAGNDLLDGNNGNDTLNGNGGQDVMQGGAGIDILNGGAGDDALIGGRGDDVLNGGAGNDELIGANVFNRDLTIDDMQEMSSGVNGPDLTPPLLLNPNATDDSGADILNGGMDDDFILMGANDTATGGAGNDIFVTMDLLTGATATATITDYTAGQDSIDVLYQRGGDVPLIDISTNAAGDAIVSLDEVQTLIVRGAGATLTAADITLLPEAV